MAPNVGRSLTWPRPQKQKSRKSLFTGSPGPTTSTITLTGHRRHVSGVLCPQQSSMTASRLVDFLCVWWFPSIRPGERKPHLATQWMDTKLTAAVAVSRLVDFLCVWWYPNYLAPSVRAWVVSHINDTGMDMKFTAAVSVKNNQSEIPVTPCF